MSMAGTDPYPMTFTDDISTVRLKKWGLGKSSRWPDAPHAAWKRFV